MEAQQAFDLSIFGRRIHGDIARFAPRQHGLPCLGIARTHEDDLLLKFFRRVYGDVSTLQERAIDAQLFSVTDLILSRGGDIDAHLYIMSPVVGLCWLCERHATDSWGV